MQQHTRQQYKDAWVKVLPGTVLLLLFIILMSFVHSPRIHEIIHILSYVFIIGFVLILVLGKKRIEARMKDTER
jgi:energy-coupling factor transporter transmembrane protein EcfT